MAKLKHRSLIEAATLLNMSVYDVRHLIRLRKVRAYKKGPHPQSPWIVLLSNEEIDQLKSTKTAEPERTVKHGQDEETAHQTSHEEDGTRVAEHSAERESERQPKRGGFTPVEWFGH